MNNHGWTPERRSRQAILIRHWKPWDQSTGPRTTEGKKRAARNSYKCGYRSHQFIEDIVAITAFLSNI